MIRARVLFEGHEAHVDYDPRRCTVDALIAAVAGARDPMMPARFSATVKQ